MLREEVRKKIKWIEISTRRLVEDVVSGQYRSHFKGSGLQFSEHRQYVPGDDVRHIDWKVSARSRDPLVKKYEEERELTVFVVADISASTEFGTQDRSTRERLAEMSAVLAHAANAAGDRVGALLFSGKIDHVVPPKKGRQQILRLTTDLLETQGSEQGTALGDALLTADRVMKHQGIVFVVSDFLAEGYEQPLRRLARRHDVVLIRIQDPGESLVNLKATVLVYDPERGASFELALQSKQVREAFEHSEQLVKELLLSLRGAGRGVEVLELRDPSGDLDALIAFMKLRKRYRKSSPSMGREA
jgi:uncharacterized protein (DUF58 family)